MNNHRCIWLMVAILCLMAGLADGQQLRIIELQHRTADEIIRIVSPQLGPDDTISGKGTVVILTVAPENLTRIEAIIRTLDKPSRQLLITVVQGENAQQVLESIDVSGNVSVGDNARIEFGRRLQPDDTVSVKARSGRSAQRNADIQRLRVQEGMAALMFIGQTIPVPTRTAQPRMDTSQSGRQVAFRQVRTGFKVIPRLSGDRFILDMASLRETSDSAAYGAVATQQIQTQIRGNLNEWIDISQLLGIKRGSETGTIYKDERQTQQVQSVFLKVAEAVH